ncbi:MAG: hypothetical protein H6565_06480 [Lewinellaceae bacterium]|nr:hypothetical protein [Lewinellaceae bacterium]
MLHLMRGLYGGGRRMWAARPAFNHTLFLLMLVLVGFPLSFLLEILGNFRTQNLEYWRQVSGYIYRPDELYGVSYEHPAVLYNKRLAHNTEEQKVHPDKNSALINDHTPPARHHAISMRRERRLDNAMP